MPEYYKPVNYCEYLIWNKESTTKFLNIHEIKGGLVQCGEIGGIMNLPDKKYSTSKTVCLCPEHAAFVFDCIDRQEIMKAKQEKANKKMKGLFE